MAAEAATDEVAAKAAAIDANPAAAPEEQEAEVDPNCVGCEKVDPSTIEVPLDPDVAAQREAAAAATAYQDSLAAEAAEEVARRDAENAVRAKAAADAEKAATEKAQGAMKAAADSLAGTSETASADDAAFQTAAAGTVDPRITPSQQEEAVAVSEQEAVSEQQPTPSQLEELYRANGVPSQEQEDGLFSDSTYFAAAGRDGEDDLSDQ